MLLGDGTECKLLTGVDDHSRYCVCAGVMVRATARPVCGAFVEALERHGVPEEVLTDNAKVFSNRFGSRATEVLFDKICRQNGIAHRRTAPRSPTTTARSSASTGRCAPSSSPGASFGSVALAQAELDAWVYSYNTDRPHQSLAMQTPADRFTPAATTCPSRRSTLERLAELFLAGSRSSRDKR